MQTANLENISPRYLIPIRGYFALMIFLLAVTGLFFILGVT